MKTEKIQFRSAYSPAESLAFTTTGDSRTKQSFKDECDVNNILRNYSKTGVMPENFNPGQFLDLDGTSYQEYMQTVASAQSMFAELPSGLRKRFDNDPSKFLSFTANPDNIAEAHNLGLLRDDYQPPEIAISPPQTATPIDETSETR